MKRIQHTTFTIERELNTSVEKVWEAFADPAKKGKWFVGPEGESEQTMDFRIGGVETSKGTIHGFEHEFKALYYEIITNERLIYSYDMYVNGERISVSLASIELEDINGKTKITLTEQDMFLDGKDASENRKQGTEGLMNQLQKFVEGR